MVGSIRHWITFKRGSILLRKEQWQKAAALLGRAVKLKPDHWESHSNLGIALLKLERWEDAAGVVQRAISLNPTAPDSHSHFGIALLKLERWEEAVAAYRRAIEVHRDSESYERMGIALSKLGQWDEAAAAYEQAIALNPTNHDLHQRLGTTLSMLERWDEAADAFRRAIDLDPRKKPDPFRGLSAKVAAPVYQQVASLNPGAPDSYASFATALGKLEASEETVAAHREAVALAPDNAAAHLSLGMELAKLGRWQEADETLAKGATLAPVDTTFQFLRIDPLVRLGRLADATAVHAQLVGRGAILPSLPGDPAPTRFERRRPAFWTPQSLSADVFRVERWLEELAAVPAPPSRDEADPVRKARLLFILDNDYGELTTLMYLLLGQPLLHQTTLLLPPRLFANNADALPGRTHCYGSLEDVVTVVDREKPDVVFLCSGYLYWAHQLFSAESLERLVGLLRDRGCRVVTTDPFLSLFSRQDPRALIKIDIPAVHPVWTVDQLIKAKRADEEAMAKQFSQAERTLRDTYHFYPSYCNIPEGHGTRWDARNLCFYNERLVRPVPETAGTGNGPKPHWMFILSSTDHETQRLFEGEWGFADIVAAKLVETVAAGRHPILVGPWQFVETVIARVPTAEGIDILSHCSFRRFTSLLLSAEHAFYWNVVSHSILIRLFNGLPVVLFDRGHLVRNVNPLFDMIVQWYYQGFEPGFHNHRQPLTLEAVTEWTEPYRREADRIRAGFRRAPTPDRMIAGLLDAELRPSV